GFHQACEWRSQAERVIVWMRIHDPVGARAERDDARLRMCATARAGPRADPFGQAPVVVIGLHHGRVEPGQLLEVCALPFRWPRRELVRVLLPSRGCDQGAVWTHRVEEREHDRVRPDDDPAERRHRRVHHHDLALTDAERTDVSDELRSSYWPEALGNLLPWHARHGSGPRPCGSCQTPM